MHCPHARALSTTLGLMSLFGIDQFRMEIESRDLVIVFKCIPWIQSMLLSMHECYHQNWLNSSFWMIEFKIWTDTETPFSLMIEIFEMTGRNNKVDWLLWPNLFSNKPMIGSCGPLILVKLNFLIMRVKSIKSFEEIKSKMIPEYKTL